MSPSPDLGPLPFKLTPETLEGCSLSYSYQSPKVGAGRQELSVAGDGAVRLSRTIVFDDEPEVREGKAPRALVARLLDLVEEERFLGLAELYPREDGGQSSRRTIVLVLPDGREHTVCVDEPRCPEFERVAGAIKVVAGAALPDALGLRFFQNL
jgi:hypothetical protein